MSKTTHTRSLGTAPVFLTAISSILGAVLFLRMGYAVGELGFFGLLAIIILGHLITIPTALAVSELSTNTRVEGGGEYFIISRSFGLKIGTTIGITLFLSQSISIAFFTVAFAEAFQPLFNLFYQSFGFELPRQVVSVPTLLLLAYFILKKGTGSSIKLLYIINVLLFFALLLFFMGGPLESSTEAQRANNFAFHNQHNFFLILAICFPAFTGMTAGVGLSGNLKNPGKSIPLGTMLGTITGFIVYVLVAWKLAASASQEDLLADQLIMSQIALWGWLVIPLGLAACTSSSALGFMMVAPRTLEAIAHDRTIPFSRINAFLTRRNELTKEPINASLVSFAIALVFVVLGSVNSIAIIITMFFLITYGALCLGSFLNHFGAPPSYRPRFKSRWYISLAGFILSVWVMFQINALYTIASYIVIILIYLLIEHNNKEKHGILNIFKGALLQLNKQLHIYIQKNQSDLEKEEWRPAALCISSHSFERRKTLDLMKWISYRHGFGTYFHYMNGYYSKQTYSESRKIMMDLIDRERGNGSNVYIDTMISPSYTSAIAQAIQSPSISGMKNNMLIFEYDQNHIEDLERIAENINLVRAGNFDVCIFSTTEHMLHTKNGIHVWIRDYDNNNSSFMIMLGYILMAHHDWKHSQIKIFIVNNTSEKEKVKESIKKRIAEGRLPITLTNIEIIELKERQSFSDAVKERSMEAGLTFVGFQEAILKRDEPTKFFRSFHGAGDILFLNTSQAKEI